jgi:hypothetical protein
MKHVLPRLRSPTPISPLALDDPLDIGDVNEELWRGRQVKSSHNESSDFGTFSVFS